MKRTLLCSLAVALAASLSLAASPAKTTVTVPASGTGAVTLSFGSGIGFQPEAVFMPALASTTQTVSYVIGSVTNTLGTLTVAANDYTLYLTNAPWLFDGDAVAVGTTATNGYTARVTGTMQR